MRTSGILMPIFSLSSPYGIGTFGKKAYEFVDFLVKGGQSYWQILPLNPTNYGDSPYQSFSSFAGNPYFIDLDMLITEGLLTEDEVTAVDFGDDPEVVDYGKLYNNRIPLLKKAYARFKGGKDYKAFCRENAFWVDEYALFMALKNAHNDVAWENWEEELRFRDEKTLKKVKKESAEIIDFYKFVQYKFDSQWQQLKAYANENGIKIIGDIPIYVAYDSADTWANPSQFLLDEELKPIKVAGCPPDAFSEDGQLWGNPLYRWDVMKKDDYSWWKKRLGYAMKLYDLIRIDHFRGFEAYYTIPYGDKNAKRGTWKKGPNMALFNAMKKEFGDDLPIIAEDLGLLTEGVRKMLRKSGFPGMKVMQFAFDGRSENEYLPHNHIANCVVYTGTHDNDTIMGWYETAGKKSLEQAKKYMHFAEDEGFNWTMMRTALMSVADTVILMMHDLMGLGSEARINVPSTVGGNWQWRVADVCINDWLASIVLENTDTYGRAVIRKKDADEDEEDVEESEAKAEEAAKETK